MNRIERVLVTGGAGMIGQRVVRQLTDLGAETAVIDNLSSGLTMPSEALRAVVGDIRSADLLSQLCQSFQPRAIIHLAAVHHIPTCEKHRAYSLDVNITGTENVLQAAEMTGVERIVIASSGAVYAWEDKALDEDKTALWACDNYAVAKLCNEAQLRLWVERTGRIGRVARVFNTIAHDDPNAHILPDIVTQLKKCTGPCAVHLGNLKPRRDYIHADDAAAGLIAILNDPRGDVGFDVFNLCAGVEYSVEELVKAIAEILEREIRIEVEDSRKRKVDRLSLLGKTQKAESLLGWRAQTSFAETVRLAIFPLMQK